jgi:hypothetical protein
MASTAYAALLQLPGTCNAPGASTEEPIVIVRNKTPICPLEHRHDIGEEPMKKLTISIAAVAAAIAFAPVATVAQGIAVDTPVGGVRIGEPGYRHYDGPVVQERRIYRERDVGLRSNCRTVTIERDDGSMKRVRRCD